MHRSLLLCASALAFATASAQRPDSVTRRPAGGASARRRADSLAFVPQFGEARPRPPGAPPEVSAVGDLVADLSPRGTTQGDGARFSLRSVELGVQSALDRQLRADVFVGVRDQQRIAIEEASLLTTSLPWGLRMRIGRVLMPVGKANTTHEHDLPSVEYPYVVQKLLATGGLRGTGLSASKAFAPFGFRQELIVSWVDRFGDAVDTLKTRAPASRYIDGMGFAARLRNYWTLSRAADLELAGSAITGNRPTAMGFTDALGVNAVNARQTVVGGDLTLRWKSPQPGRARSFLLQAEWMLQANDRGWLVNPTAEGAPIIHDYDGAYVYARWQLGQRLFAGGRFDTVQDPAALGARLNAGSAVLEWFPGAATKVLASYERRKTAARPGEDRILLQASFALGTHAPHPFW